MSNVGRSLEARSTPNELSSMIENPSGYLLTTDQAIDRCIRTAGELVELMCREKSFVSAGRGSSIVSTDIVASGTTESKTLDLRNLTIRKHVSSQSVVMGQEARHKAEAIVVQNISSLEPKFIRSLVSNHFLRAKDGDHGKVKSSMSLPSRHIAMREAVITALSICWRKVGEFQRVASQTEFWNHANQQHYDRIVDALLESSVEILRNSALWEERIGGKRTDSSEFSLNRTDADSALVLLISLADFSNTESVENLLYHRRLMANLTDILSTAAEKRQTKFATEIGTNIIDSLEKAFSNFPFESQPKGLMTLVMKDLYFAFYNKVFPHLDRKKVKKFENFFPLNDALKKEALEE